MASFSFYMMKKQFKREARAMRDKSLGIWLMVLFGISGIAILVLAWLRPMPGLERALTTFIGAFGLFVALSRVPRLKSPKVGTDAEQVTIEVGVQNKN